MKTSEEINELVIAMNKFQKEVEPPKKNNENPAFKREGKKLKYADLDAIIKAITPKLTENGLSQMQFTSSDLEKKSVSVTTLITHSSGQFIMSEPLILPAENYGKFNAQTIGSSITYGRRYSLSAMLGIASEDDDDANIQSLQDDENKQEVKPATDIQKSGLKKLMESLTEHTGRTYQEIEAVVMQKGNVPRKPYEQITNEDYGRMLAYTKGLIEYYDKQKNEQSSMEFTYGGNDQ